MSANQDQIERDRLLTEVHSDVKHLVANFNIHTKNDEDSFKSMKTRMFWMTIAIAVLGTMVGGPSVIMALLK